MEKRAEDLNRQQRNFINKHGRGKLDQVRKLRIQGHSNNEIAIKLNIDVVEIIKV